MFGILALFVAAATCFTLFVVGSIFTYLSYTDPDYSSPSSEMTHLVYIGGPLGWGIASFYLIAKLGNAIFKVFGGF